MMTTSELLNQLAPAGEPWSPDWQDVLRRTNRPGTATRGRRRARRMRRSVLVLAISAAICAPLLALGATNDWWFLSSGDTPTPTASPAIVSNGTWNGQPWTLIAYPSATDGVCFSITPNTQTSTGQNAAMNCAPITGVARTPTTKATPDLTITYLIAGASRDLPAYIAGPVIATATHVEIDLLNGSTLEADTTAAPASIGDIRFYAIELPESDAPTSTSTAPTSIVQRLIGTDEDGNVVACLVPATAVNGVSPLNDC